MISQNAKKAINEVHKALRHAKHYLSILENELFTETRGRLSAEERLIQIQKALKQSGRLPKEGSKK